MALRARLTAKVGRVFTKVSNKLDGTIVVNLVKGSDDYDEFETLFEVESKRFFEFKSNRQELFLQIADDTDELTEAMAEATHVQIDDDYYQIRTDDTLPPKSTDVTWKIEGDLLPKQGEHYATI